jgi:hypothetical protein
VNPALRTLGTFAGAREAAPEPLVDARTLAGYLGVTVAYVYEHADELGARRLGSGPKARLRFSVAEVDSRLTACSASRGSGSPEARTVEPKPRRRRSSSLGSATDLLPIRGSGGSL